MLSKQKRVPDFAVDGRASLLLLVVVFACLGLASKSESKKKERSVVTFASLYFGLNKTNNGCEF